MKVWLSIILMPVLLIASTHLIRAQEASINEIDLSNPEFRTQFIPLEFKGKFAQLVTADTTNNYFIVDMTHFQSKFEKIWFLTLIFSSEKIVSFDSGIGQEQLWFLAHRLYSEKEILEEFTAIKEKTLKESSQLTESEKSEWMKINDKYK